MLDKFDSQAESLEAETPLKDQQASDDTANAFRLELAHHKPGHRGGGGARIEPIPPWTPDPICRPPFDPWCDKPDPFPKPWPPKPHNPKPPGRKKG